MQMLSNKVAIVTGASSGIGNATARLLARHGARVVVTARRKAELDLLVAAIEQDGGHAIAVPGDVRDETAASQVVAAAVDHFGGLDIAVNNAGSLGEMGATQDISLSGWQETLDINLTGAFLGAKHQIPPMIARGGGSMIFISSFVGHTVGFPGMAAYASSKAGLLGLTRTLAVELGAHTIRVNALLPGATDTPSNAANLPGAAPETRAFIEGLHALKRLASADEIAHSALHLASDASSFITGTTSLVDGGVSIVRT